LREKTTASGKGVEFQLGHGLSQILWNPQGFPGFNPRIGVNPFARMNILWQDDRRNLASISKFGLKVLWQ